MLMLKRNNSEKICNLVLCSKCYSKALTAALLHVECFTVMGTTLQQVFRIWPISSAVVHTRTWGADSWHAACLLSTSPHVPAGCSF